jgi:hypothetical protein
MSMLPPEFADLEHRVPEWALTSEEERFRKLHSIAYDDLAAFYKEMLPRLPAILDYLGQHKLSAMPPDALTLYNLALTMVETSHPMDLGWGATDFPGAYRWDAFNFASISKGSRAKLAPAASPSKDVRVEPNASVSERDVKQRRVDNAQEAAP